MPTTMATSPPPPTPNPQPSGDDSMALDPPQTPENGFTTAAALGRATHVKTSIYQVYFPIELSKKNPTPRNPYRCVKHILAILAKNCDQIHVLPKDDTDPANEAICLWTDFPTTKEAASAYLFNISYPSQNFGARAGIVNFRAEFRVSCSSSVKWMKKNSAVLAELARHKYSVTGRADGPTVPMRPILWLVQPDPDNCSTAQLKNLLLQQLPVNAALHLEKHRLTSRPNGKSKTFVTHALKVLAATSTAWTTKKTLDKYLNDDLDTEKPIPLRGVRSAGLTDKDISKIDLAMLITVQNKHLNSTVAVQIANVWHIDKSFKLPMQLIDTLATENLAEEYDANEVCDFLRNPDSSHATIRELLYAVIEAREDIQEPTIMADYVRNGKWNIVCKKENVQTVTDILDWFLTVIGRVMGVEELSTICGSFRPYDQNQQPRVEFIKRYQDGYNETHLKKTYGSSLSDFKRQYAISGEDQNPEKDVPPDYSKPPKETYRPTHFARMEVIGVDRPTWASTLYETSFNQKEPAVNPYAVKRSKSYAAATGVSKNKTKTTKTTTSPPVPPSPNTPNPTSTQIPTTATTATSTNVSSLTPTQSKSTHKPQPVTPTQAAPESSLLHDTQTRLDALAKDMTEIQSHRTALDTKLSALEKGQNQLTTTVQDMADSIKLLLKDRRQTTTEPNPTSTSTSDLDDFKKSLKRMLKKHQTSAPSKKDFADYKAHVSDMMDQRFTQLANGLRRKGAIDHIPGVTSTIQSQALSDAMSEDSQDSQHDAESLDDCSMTDIEATDMPSSLTRYRSNQAKREAPTIADSVSQPKKRQQQKDTAASEEG